MVVTDDEVSKAAKEDYPQTNKPEKRPNFAGQNVQRLEFSDTRHPQLDSASEARLSDDSDM